MFFLIAESVSKTADFDGRHRVALTGTAKAGRWFDAGILFTARKEKGPVITVSMEGFNLLNHVNYVCGEPQLSVFRPAGLGFPGSADAGGLPVSILSDYEPPSPTPILPNTVRLDTEPDALYA